MKTTLGAYLTTLIAFVGPNFVWLSLAADRLYRPALAEAAGLAAARAVSA